MIKYLQITRPGENRRGAALAEVLIAVIAMGIGIVSLAALFPVAVLRSVQGHQLTQGTILRFAAESKIDAMKVMYVRPNPAAAPGPNPAEKFLFDPLGMAVGLAGTLGPLKRYDGGFGANEDTAAGLVAANDNWIDRYTDIATGSNLKTATLPNLAAQNITNDTNNTRAVLFDVSGNVSQVRALTDVGVLGNTVTWSPSGPADTRDLPNPPFAGSDGFGLNCVGKVRIETKERQFTWMLTCRRTGTYPNFSTDIDVTVFFRRSFDKDTTTNAEPVFSNGGGQVFMAGSNVANVAFTGGNNPTLRRGSFVFDATNARWYRMEGIVDNGTSAVITLDKPAVATGTAAVFFGGIVDVYALETKHD